MKFQDCFYSSGTVRQLSRKGKPWQGTLKYKDSNGDWKSVTKMLNDATGKKDAERLLKEWQSDLERQTAASIIKNPRELKKKLGKSVTDVIQEYVERQRKLNEIEESSYTHQQRVIKNYIKPYLSEVDFVALRREQIQEWISYLSNDKGLKYYTVNEALSILKKVYRYYYNTEQITKNPCVGIVFKDKEVREKNILTASDYEFFIDTVMSATKTKFWSKTAYLLAFYTGMRCEEICGLRWLDVNLPAEKLIVNVVVGTSDNDLKRGYLKKPKYACSHRTIPLMKPAVDILKRQYDLQLKEYQKSNPEEKEIPLNHFVCGEYDGKEFRIPACLSARFRQFCAYKGINGTTGKPLSLHDLRHTFATNAVASGMDVKSISSVIGHANAAMTLNVYAAADEDAIRAGMDKLAEYMEEKEETAGYVGL